MIQPFSVTLATATRAGRPSARVVLLRGRDTRGFVFFTNYESRKGRDLSENPFAALDFYWPELDRQIRIEGAVEKSTEAESDAYFHSRPRGSQISACASDQSKAIDSRDALEGRVEHLEKKYEGKVIPRPAFWGGYRLIPNLFEFWQEGPFRLHDRFEYRPAPSGGWMITRLSP